MSTPQTIPFTLEFEGRTYQCERTVTGTRALYQSIRVSGVGTKDDTARYARGGGGHAPETMASIARILARELIQESRRGA